MPRAPRPSFAAFLRDRRGVTAMTLALLAGPGLLAVGAAIDLGRAQVVKSRLSSALDSAALAVGGTVGLTDAQAQTLALNYIKANFPSSMGTVSTPKIVKDATLGTVQLTATAQMNATFMKIFGVSVINVAAVTEVKSAESALMVSLVLDVTGSMWSSNNIGSLRTAALDLVGILYGQETSSENLRIAVVPYAASVNPGAVAADLVESGHGLGAAGSSDLLGWKGCVVERSGTHTLGDTPAGAGQYWTPYRNPVALDNAWIEGDANSVEPGGTSNSNGFRGPNLGCPNPIVPLTKSRATVETALNGLTAWNRGGTLTDIGMAWGIRTLSPGAPFAQSNETDAKTNKSLWTSDRWDKAIVLMTDGESTFFRMTGTQNPTNQPAAPKGYTRLANVELAGALSDYTGYGRFGGPLSVGIFGNVALSNANSQLNTRIENLCTTAKGQGIVVYTVVFTSGVGTSVRDMYRRCASDPGKYWFAPSQNALRSAFKQIGQDLIRLHVSR